MKRVVTLCFCLGLMTSLWSQNKKIIIKQSGEEKIRIQDLDIDVKEGEDGEMIILMNGEEMDISELEDLDIDIDLDDDLEKYQVRVNMNGDWAHEIGAQHDDRPMMGVMVENAGGNGAMITEVWPGSGAEAAGLKVGDLILKVGKKQVTDVESLVSELSQYEQGDQVKLRYLRAGKKQKAKVTLSKVQSPRAKSKPHKKVKVEKIVRKENPPLEKPAVDMYELSMDYQSERASLVLEFKAKSVPTTVSIVSASGQTLYQKNLNPFDGSFMEEIELTEDQKMGAKLVISQEGKTIEHVFE